MTRYIVIRMIQMVVLFIIFITVTWFLLYSLPGDIVATRFASDPNLPPEAREIAVARLGLDKPLIEQYWNYLMDFFRLDFGFSFSQYPTPVTDIIAERLPRTLVLFSTALITSFYVGFLAGKVLAWRRGKRGEMAITVAGITLNTVFYPWFALMMLWFFSAQLGWLPISKFLNPSEWIDAPYTSNSVFLRTFALIFLTSIVLFVTYVTTQRMRNISTRNIYRFTVTIITLVLFVLFWTITEYGSTALPYALDLAEHLILPVAVLTLVGFAGTMLLTRSSMLETMREDFILTARAKGLSERAIRDGHAARTALLPVATSLVIAVVTVIDGGIITESVFSWPGMGQILVSSVTSEDIPLAIASFSLIGGLAMFGHFAADILYRFLDPRIRISG